MTNVIEEEDEASLPADQGGSEKSSRRPSSAGSLRSGRQERMDVQRRASSAGTVINVFEEHNDRRSLKDVF